MKLTTIIDAMDQDSGWILYVDDNGSYHCEYMDIIHDVSHNEENNRYIVHRFDIDRCTFINGILSDNPFHPELPAWFADGKGVDDVAKCCDHEDIVEDICSEDPKARCRAWISIGSYHGFYNLDSYPLGLTQAEVDKRY